MNPQPFHQSTPWTCGPSCAMMVRSIFENYVPTAEDERKIWDQTRTSSKYPYCTHPRLASYLMQQGYHAQLWHTNEAFFTWPFADKTSARFWDFRARMKLYNSFVSTAKVEGLGLRVAPITQQDICDRLEHGNVALVMTKIGNESIFHHILLYQKNKAGYDALCPLRGKLNLTYEQLESDMSLPFGKGMLWVWR
ncbi:MAG TPA: peptidase C39 family protein [Acidobacteriota bacterium]|nr:peptidase C39 family protein [Acidobacteriota bacterium]